MLACKMGIRKRLVFVFVCVFVFVYTNIWLNSPAAIVGLSSKSNTEVGSIQHLTIVNGVEKGLNSEDQVLGSAEEIHYMCI